MNSYRADATCYQRSFDKIEAGGRVVAEDRMIATEVPVAIEIGGLGYAVLMASPADLIDLAYGFVLTERLIDSADDVLDVDLHAAPLGTILRITLADRVSGRIADRVRHRTTDTSCGLCGIESLEQALRPLPPLAQRWTGSTDMVFTAAAALGGLQELNRATRSVHAAARCGPDGKILAVREDVGRHNAFDKLIGATLRAGDDWSECFALLSSRCSFELVEKAAIAGCGMLATVSAATDLALQRAREAGMILHVVVRADALLTPRT